MRTKTVVLWGRGDLLSSSVELSLAAQKGWKVVNVYYDENNPETLIKTVDTINPDIVIMQKGDLAINMNLPTLLLHDHPELKVVTINHNNNMMEVFSKQNILITSVSDLTSIVETDRKRVTRQQLTKLELEQKGGQNKEKVHR